MLFQSLSNLASRAIASVRPAARLPFVVRRSPGPRVGVPSRPPDVELTEGVFTVTVCCTVPGATRDNVTVCWDDDCHTLAIRVARASESDPRHDWYVEIPLPPTAVGEESVCTLDGSNLRVRAPRRDTPVSTSLVLLVAPDEARVQPEGLAFV